MIRQQVIDFFGVHPSVDAIPSFSVVRTLEDILNKNDKGRYQTFRKSIMHQMTTTYRKKGAWVTADRLYDAFKDGKQDDLVSRATFDLEGYFENGKPVRTFFEGGFVVNLIGSESLDVSSLAKSLLQRVEELYFEKGTEPSVDVKRDRINQVVRILKQLPPSSFRPDQLGSILYYSTPWLRSRNSEDIKQRVTEDVAHYYRFGIEKEDEVLDRLKINHFLYNLNVYPTGQQFDEGRVARIYYLKSNHDFFVKLWNGDQKYRYNWDQELHMVGLMQDMNIPGVLKARKVPVLHNHSVQSGIVMDRIDGYSLDTLSKNKKTGSKLYFVRGTEEQLSHSLAEASKHGIHIVDLNMGNVLMRRLGETREDGRHVFLYGDPTIIDPGVWADQGILQVYYKQFGEKSVIEDQTQKMQEVFGFIRENPYSR